MKDNKGITLIALAITIIILIIIASVSTYSGVEALKDSRAEARKSEIKMIQQAVLENYALYQKTNDTNYLIGSATSIEEVQKVIDRINSSKSNEYSTISLKINYNSEDITEKYYILEKADLKKMGFAKTESDSTDESITKNIEMDNYIINYKTGEVMNATLYVTSRKEPLYTSSIENTKVPIEINIYSGTVTSVTVSVTSTNDITELKYVWTKLLNEPDKKSFQKNVPINNIITDIPQEKGNYYLWIYAKDRKGNEKIVPSRGCTVN